VPSGSRTGNALDQAPDGVTIVGGLCDVNVR
jgi:hypothetical protein